MSAKIIDFVKQKLFVGIDMHQRQWTVTLRMAGIYLKTCVINPSPVDLANYLKRNYPGAEYHSVYEAGFGGFWAHFELRKLGIQNIVINPADVPTTNKEKSYKKDKVDSKKLAREHENGSLEAIYVPPVELQQLRSLCRARFRIVQNLTRIKNRIKAFLHYYGYRMPNHHELPRWSGRFISWLHSLEFAANAGKDCLDSYLSALNDERKNLTHVMRRLRQYSRTPEIAHTFECIKSVKGIGFVTAMVLYTEIIDMRRFKNLARLAAFVGLVPSISSSDENETTHGLTHRRNRYLRTLLIEAAWVAVRSDPALTHAFCQLTRKMPKERAIVRIAKKLLNRVRHVWLHQTRYVPAVVK
ncbi:MAG: IS110 family transposase [bacterium]